MYALMIIAIVKLYPKQIVIYVLVATIEYNYICFTGAKYIYKIIILNASFIQFCVI